MKRRTFVRLTTAGAVALYLPNIRCNGKSSSFTRVLARPGQLQHICDSKTIREIGKAYKKLAEHENETALVKLLSTDKDDKAISEMADSAAIASMLAEKIRQDFVQNKIVVADGWVLSVTEARQCALFSLTEN